MNAHNEKQLRKLLLALNHRLSPTVFLIGCDTGAQRQRLMAAIEAGSPQYKHIIVDLGPHAVFSLRDAIARIVPDEVKASKRLEYVVHFTGLSSSLWATNAQGKLEHTRLMDELNFERERLFHDYPFISFIWESTKFMEDLFYQAGDLYVWLVDRYAFEREEEDEVVEEIPGKTIMGHIGPDPKRLTQIARLEDLLGRLNEGGDAQKFLREKMDTLVSLGHECTRAFEFDKAERYLMEAKKLIGLHYAKSFREAGVEFFLGSLFLEKRDFERALVHYQNSLSMSQVLNDGENIGNSYHQIGLVYEEQRRWDNALRNYRLALEWKRKSGSQFDVGHTYHQIGRVYQMQRRWEDALENYRLALEWKGKTDNWFGLGRIYHQIGMISEEQGRWKDALLNYQLSLELNEKTGDKISLGGTYYQMGRVYEQQSDYPKALQYYQFAKENMLTFRNPQITIAEASIARVTKQLEGAKTHPKTT